MKKIYIVYMITGIVGTLLVSIYLWLFISKIISTADFISLLTGTIIGLITLIIAFLAYKISKQSDDTQKRSYDLTLKLESFNVAKQINKAISDWKTSNLPGINLIDNYYISGRNLLNIMDYLRNAMQQYLIFRNKDYLYQIECNKCNNIWNNIDYNHKLFSCTEQLNSSISQQEKNNIYGKISDAVTNFFIDTNFSILTPKIMTWICLECLFN